ncbi:hypothetical protein [Pseudomonas paeninsulae]|uniref:hypothetical protein n=1 Tax=Pseudomonas paeninsulae TaxID=3110772 RepID=UPI002D79993F|nr:hypothetical protein [Pseudomonas sp. IT1137]
MIGKNLPAAGDSNSINPITVFFHGYAKLAQQVWHVETLITAYQLPDRANAWLGGFI